MFFIVTDPPQCHSSSAQDGGLDVGVVANHSHMVHTNLVPLQFVCSEVVIFPFTSIITTIIICQLTFTSIINI